MRASASHSRACSSRPASRAAAAALTSSSARSCGSSIVLVQVERVLEVLDRGRAARPSARASSPSAPASIASASRLPLPAAIAASARTTRCRSSSWPCSANRPADQRQRVEAVVQVLALLPAPQQPRGSARARPRRSPPAARGARASTSTPSSAPKMPHLPHDGRRLHDPQARRPALAAARVDLAHHGGGDRAVALVERGVVDQRPAEREAAAPLAALAEHVAEAGRADGARRRRSPCSAQ